MVDTVISRVHPRCRSYWSPYQTVLQPAGSLTGTAQTTATSAFAPAAGAASCSLSSHLTETPNEAPTDVCQSHRGHGAPERACHCHGPLPGQPALPNQTTAFQKVKNLLREGLLDTEAKSPATWNEINAGTKHKQSQRSTFFAGICTIGNLKKRPSELTAQLKMMPQRQSFSPRLSFKRF